MRLTTPFTPAPTAKVPPQTPKNHTAEPRFGQIVASHPQNATSTTSALAPRDAGALMFALVVGVPALMAGFYKLVQAWGKNSENRRLNRAHERMLADAEAHFQTEEETYTLQEILHSENASLHQNSAAEASLPERPEPALTRAESVEHSDM